MRSRLPSLVDIEYFGLETLLPLKDIYKLWDVLFFMHQSNYNFSLCNNDSEPCVPSVTDFVFTARFSLITQHCWSLVCWRCECSQFSHFAWHPHQSGMDYRKTHTTPSTENQTSMYFLKGLLKRAHGGSHDPWVIGPWHITEGKDKYLQHTVQLNCSHD